jgi:4'-phosphopantetheinyl transferase
LDDDQVAISSLFESLSDDEKLRAGRFLFKRHREHYIVGRGTLRRILGAYLGRGPGSLKFSYDRFGKPRLSQDGGGLRFNVSHSNGIGLIAVTMYREVGVDIEYIDRKIDVLSVASRAFSAEKAARLRSLPESLRTPAFFSMWTRTEARLKAMGVGLSGFPEQQSVVSGHKNQEDRSFAVSAVEKVTEGSSTPLETHDEYKAALAVEGSIGAVDYLQLADNFAPKTAGRLFLHESETAKGRGSGDVLPLVAA